MKKLILSLVLLGGMVACSHSKESSEIKNSDEEMGVSGEVSKESIRKVIKDNHKGISACYTKALGKKQNLQGKVIFEWMVTDSGQVSGAKVLSSTLNSSEVEDCIIAKLKTLRFSAPPSGREAVISYPIYFNN